MVLGSLVLVPSVLHSVATTPIGLVGSERTVTLAVSRGE